MRVVVKSLDRNKLYSRLKQLSPDCKEFFWGYVAGMRMLVSSAKKIHSNLAVPIFDVQFFDKLPMKQCVQVLRDCRKFVRELNRLQINIGDIPRYEVVHGLQFGYQNYHTLGCDFAMSRLARVGGKVWFILAGVSGTDQNTNRLLSLVDTYCRLDLTVSRSAYGPSCELFLTSGLGELRVRCD